MQMPSSNMYLNDTHEHWVREGEIPSVGFILCTPKGNEVVQYSLEELRRSRRYLEAKVQNRNSTQEKEP